MKNYALIFVHTACAFVLFTTACSHPAKSKLVGKWQGKDGKAHLNITEKGLTMDDEQFAEDYFLKGDTIYTSYQGNQPYTSFVVEKLDDHYLKLMGPDSVAVEYSR